MIRTRDFILFVVTLLFLTVAIVSTVAVKSNPQRAYTQSLAISDGIDVSGATAEQNEIDRRSVIERLREKIRNSDLAITLEPSVEPEETLLDAASTTVPAATLLRCAQPDDALAIVPKWPLTNVQIAVAEDVRLVFTQEEVVVSGSEIEEETTESLVNTLLQLPAAPVKAVQPYCVPSEVIGVTPRGVLMFNGDKRSYRNAGENTLLGYARDGFPIYGVYEGATDECGGYEHPLGYRYTASAERDYVIGCFAAQPQQFSL